MPSKGSERKEKGRESSAAEEVSGRRTRAAHAEEAAVELELEDADNAGEERKKRGR